MSILFFLGDNFTLSQEKSREIKVTGVGIVSVLPNRAELNFQVSSKEEKATSALETNNKKIQQAIQSLRQAGVPDTSIATSNFYVQPQPEYRRDELVKMWYSSSSSLRVILNDIYNVGKVIDKLVSDGITAVNAPIFSVTFEDSLRNEAYKKAVENATGKAQKLAETFGVNLGTPVQISVDMGDVEPRKYYYDDGIMKLQAGTIIMPYYVRKQVTLNVTFEISDSSKK